MIKHINNKEIQRFLDGEVTPGESAEIKSHLNICQQCRQEYESYILIFKALKQEPENDFSTQFTYRVLSRIKSSSRLARDQRSPDILLAIAGIVISIITSLFFINSEPILNLISAVDRIIPERLPYYIGINDWLPNQTMYPYFLTGIIILLIITFLERVVFKKKGLIYLL
jgi:hypothetical protein